MEGGVVLESYVCIKDFHIENLDDIEDEGNYTLVVMEGSIWTEEEDTSGEIRLERTFGDTHQWMEIPKKTFEKYFRKHKS